MRSGQQRLTGVVALVTAGTLAVFQDPTNQTGGNTFSTGQISLNLTSNLATMTYTANTMMPGHQASGSVTVTNNAPAGAQNKLRYAITVDSGSSPASPVDALDLTVRRADGDGS